MNLMFCAQKYFVLNELLLPALPKSNGFCTEQIPHVK